MKGLPYKVLQTLVLYLIKSHSCYACHHEFPGSAVCPMWEVWVMPLHCVMLCVADFLITCHIYESCGLLTPGELTDLRSALVNNVTFASLTVRNGFHKFMKYTSPKLMDVVDSFVKFQEERNHVINEEVGSYCYNVVASAVTRQVSSHPGCHSFSLCWAWKNLFSQLQSSFYFKQITIPVPSHSSKVWVKFLH